ncbi:prepilin peptidase [Clostridium lundense]|uniref:prepilin peptidase n=1 Tax=Clostridium lundense TaxID=319475 RepID=UPI00054FEFE0|nr:A24 family peptidase [Clostridium lundense]
MGNYLVIYYVFSFIMGSIIGSFLNVCIYRIPREESLAYPSSHCPKCNNKLKWRDLIPIISYMFLKGKCRYCKEKIGVRYPLIELFTGIVYLIVAIEYGVSLNYLKYVTLLSILIVISFIDMQTMDVYFSITVTGVIFGLIFLVTQGILQNYILKDYIYYILGGIVPAGIISLIILLTGGMGWGDVEICFISGIFLGLKRSLLMFLLSFIIGTVISLGLILCEKKTRKDPIPFGPFIALGTLCTLIFGDNILLWYLSFI